METRHVEDSRAGDQEIQELREEMKVECDTAHT